MEEIKKLREKTGAGIVDCRNALAEAGGDIEKAAEILRKKGIAKAAKRSDREAKEGIVRVGVDNSAGNGWIIEFNSETDFVARNEKFRNFTDEIFALAKTSNIASLDELLAAKTASGASVKEALDVLSGTIGEKLDIKRMEKVSSAGTVAAYSHMDGRIGVLVALNAEDKEELAREVAMQVAASNPVCISRDQIPAESLEKEKEIYREQLKKENKPENMIEKILEGKLNKYYEEVCLVDQEYIKDDKKKVKDVLGDAVVEKMVRFAL